MLWWRVTIWKPNQRPYRNPTKDVGVTWWRHSRKCAETLRRSWHEAWTVACVWVELALCCPFSCSGCSQSLRDGLAQKDLQTAGWMKAYVWCMKVLIEVDILEQICQGIPVAIFPFLFDIVVCLQTLSPWMRCYHPLDSGFGSSSQVDLGATEPPRSAIGATAESCSVPYEGRTSFWRKRPIVFPLQRWRTSGLPWR